MGKKIVLEVPREPYVYDGTERAGKEAYARAHRPYKCLLCGEMQPAGKAHHCGDCPHRKEVVRA